jgi:hypothetical protein
MQSKAVLVLSTAFIFASASAADAQFSNVTMLPSRFSFGGDLAISQPKGEFASNVPNGYGFDLTGMFRLDPQGYFNLRADLGGVRYGHERQRIGFPISGRIAVDLNTDNQIPDGWFRPYANASIAATYFWTESSISGADNSESVLSTTNLDDWSHAWIFGGGVMIPFGRSIGALNLGARYHYGATATYLKKGDITDNPDGTINLNPRNSKTDLVLWQLGVSFAIPRSTGH